MSTSGRENSAIFLGHVGKLRLCRGLHCGEPSSQNAASNARFGAGLVTRLANELRDLVHDGLLLTLTNHRSGWAVMTRVYEDVLAEFNRPRMIRWIL